MSLENSQCGRPHSFQNSPISDMLVRMKKIWIALPAIALMLAMLPSCGRRGGIPAVGETDLFTLGYGNFEDELNLFDLAEAGEVGTRIAMRDGFFYIANGESRKIMELNSYGDLLCLYYNPEFMRNTDFARANAGNVTKRAVEYPFNTLGAIAVDGEKSLYAVDALPPERHERDEKRRLLLSNVVLRFGADGKFIDYIGQQGPGGTPFPFVKDIYTTRENELVVVCRTNDGLDVYWFAPNGFLLYNVPITAESVPGVEGGDGGAHFSIESAIPDPNGHRLFLKVDYYEDVVDADLKVLAGISYSRTVLFPLDVETGRFDDGLEIPGYERTFSDGAVSRDVSVVPFDFLGATEGGWLFFIVPTASGYVVQMVQPDGQSVVKRTLSVDHSKVLYHSLSLSGGGIISGLFARRENALLSWWRTDSLLSSFGSE